MNKEFVYQVGNNKKGYTMMHGQPNIKNFCLICPNVLSDLNVMLLRVYKKKCTLVQALRLCTGRTAHRGSRGIALLFHDQRH